MLASLILARGVPLLLAGDEVSNSQGGNNNAYCQDNSIGWIDWSKRGDPHDDLTPMIAALTSLRRQYPQLEARKWPNGDGNRRIELMWLTPHATEMTEEDWNFAEARFLAYILAPLTEPHAALFIVMNAGLGPVDFVYPEFEDCERWTEVFSTEVGNDQNTAHPVGSTYAAPPQSVKVFAGDV
jgi:glycogen operon protein